jgi:hypothetical protein
MSFCFGASQCFWVLNRGSGLWQRPGELELAGEFPALSLVALVVVNRKAAGESGESLVTTAAQGLQCWTAPGNNLEAWPVAGRGPN